MKICLLGTGFIAGVHARNLRASGRADIVGICGTTAERTREFIAKTEIGAARAFTNFDHMLDECAPDALYVCIPPHAHDGEVERAAARSVHIFAEKPIARTVQRAASMRTAVEQAGVVSQVGYQMRFRKTLRRLHELIAVGETGRPTLFQARYFARFDGSAWWRDQARSGGQFFEQAIHLYDLALHLFGPAERVSGLLANIAHRSQPDYTVEDSAAVWMQFANGALGSFCNSNCAVREQFNGDFRAVFEHVTADYRSTGDWRVPEMAMLHFADGCREEVVEDGNAYLDATLDFLDAIEQRRPALAPIADGEIAVRVLTAIGESAAQGGTPVSLNRS